MQFSPVFLDSVWVGLGFRVQGSRDLRVVFELITAKGWDFRQGFVLRAWEFRPYLTHNDLPFSGSLL